MIKELFILIIISLVLFACTSEEGDEEVNWRHNYTGDYHFMKVTDHWTENTGHQRDTTFYDGFVQADHDNLDSFIIKCGEGIMRHGWSEYFSARGYFRDTSEHPKFTVYNESTSYFLGNFINTDSLIIIAHYGGHGGGTGWTYHGKMTRK